MKESIFQSKNFWVIFSLVLLAVLSFLLGRITAPGPTTPYRATFARSQIASGNRGLLRPARHIISPPTSLPSPSLLLGEGEGRGAHQWYIFSDPWLDIQVRAVSADTIQYQFKKAWHDLQPHGPYIKSIRVFGVAPDSVQLEGDFPDQSQKNFSLIASITTQPAGHLLAGYKNFMVHVQYTPRSVLRDTLRSPWSFGLAYHLRF